MTIPDSLQTVGYNVFFLSLNLVPAMVVNLDYIDYSDSDDRYNCDEYDDGVRESDEVIAYLRSLQN